MWYKVEGIKGSDILLKFISIFIIFRSKYCNSIPPNLTIKYDVVLPGMNSISEMYFYVCGIKGHSMMLSPLGMAGNSPWNVSVGEISQLTMFSAAIAEGSRHSGTKRSGTLQPT